MSDKARVGYSMQFWYVDQDGVVKQDQLNQVPFWPITNDASKFWEVDPDWVRKHVADFVNRGLEKGMKTDG